MVQNAVSGLRKVIERHARPTGAVSLSTSPPGYRLTIEPENFDLGRFRRLVEQGGAELRAGHKEAGLAQLRAALGLWRGPALSDLTEAGIAWPELTAIAGVRLAVFEDCTREALNQNRHHEVLGELQEMAAAEPAGERICGLLMLALYRCGRQHDALAAYQRTRGTLLDDFGLDPGRELRELELAILNQDPALAPDPGPRWTRTVARPSAAHRCSRLGTLAAPGGRARPAYRRGYA